MAFKLLIYDRVHDEIDEAAAYYFSKSERVAFKFFDSLQIAYESLILNPFFEVRYLDYRCLPIFGFPFMFHFTVEEKENTVHIHALINTYKNPEKNWLSE